MKITKNKEITKVCALICPNCKDIIYSRAHHDFHHCSCKEIAVDGGFEYIRCAFKNIPPEQINKTIKASKTELYKDWNSGADKFGIIKGSLNDKK